MKQKQIDALRETNFTAVGTHQDNPDHTFTLTFEDGHWYMEDTFEWDGLAASGPISKKGMKQLQLMFEKEHALGSGELVH
jgi:hypothetical protein